MIRGREEIRQEGGGETTRRRGERGDKERGREDGRQRFATESRGKPQMPSQEREREKEREPTACNDFPEPFCTSWYDSFALKEKPSATSLDFSNVGFRVHSTHSSVYAIVSTLSTTVTSSFFLIWVKIFLVHDVVSLSLARVLSVFVLFVCLFVCFFFCLFVCLPACLSVCLSLSLSA